MAGLKPHFGLLILVLVLGFGLRIWGIDNGLPHSQLTDETSDISTAMRIARGEVPRYTYHRVTWPLVQLPLYSLYYVYNHLTQPDFSLEAFEALYFANRADFILMARLLSAFFSTLAIIPVYLGALALTQSTRAGLLAACCDSGGFNSGVWRMGVHLPGCEMAALASFGRRDTDRRYRLIRNNLD